MAAERNFSWDVPAEFNFARDVVDELGKEDRLGLLFVDTAGARHPSNFPELAAETRRWAAVLRDLGIVLPLELPARRLSVAQQQMVEIAKSLARKARLIVMDEPKSPRLELRRVPIVVFWV